MKSILLFSFIVFSHFLMAQDSIVWKKEYQMEIQENAIWTNDQYNNLYLANIDLINKIDPSGEKMFEQSLKKYGQIAKIDARNPMKILIFSEQQQSIFYLDNTLTKQNNDIDLSDFNLNYVTQVSASNQIDKIWTFDQDNSKITLITQRQAQSIQIENISGIMDVKNISQFYEQNDRLFVIDNQKGIYIFDLYGTFIQYLPEENFICAEVNQEYLYLLRNDSLDILNLKTYKKKKIQLPVQNIQRFTVNQQTLFFETPSLLYKFHLDFF